MATPIGEPADVSAATLARRAYARDYHHRNRERILAYQRAYQQKNRQEIAERKRAHQKANPSGYRARAREWRIANPDKIRATFPRRVERDRERKHGVTPADVKVMLASQGFRCAICRGDNPGRRTNWHLDHDHETGAVRGLLCSPCNLGIGQLRDDPHVLMAAATYLLTHKARRKVV